MTRKFAMISLVLALAMAAPARAEIINLSCDDGGMLLLTDTEKGTVSDRNPFQSSEVTVPLTVTATAYTWREMAGGVAADYALDKSTRKVTAISNGENVALSNPQCGKSARLVPK
jgi:hypothetical protein